ncbi:hypothetical protein O7600_20160 [Micromonospora sp. WMMA1998]|uniref:hypothetical protein n=1 Tax=Micromonospora sp. WMMA1998 TaxID=3015167 RepID=UPI00248CA539|nr:hypothetical protein [Micromonospora sp. WMMA1998]WBC13446.1 hypothetical protein O7600_20160 [Micromonospora sp. WMMA1998]
MTGPTDDAAQLAEHGLAARILLAYLDGDPDHVGELVNADPNAAMNAVIALAGGLAATAWGPRAQVALRSISTAADLDAIGREVTG